MRQIREILRLSLQLNLSANEISGVLGVSRGKVQDVLRRAHATETAWPLPESDESLYQTLYPPVNYLPQEQALPDWERINAQLRRKGVTLQLLWQEYLKENSVGFSYSQFCRLYRSWASQRDLVMRQEHRAGEKLFVDYAGQKVPIICRFSGEVKLAAVFVAVFGASNYCYAEASESETLRDWLSSHIRALRFFGGSPKFVVPDNLKNAVIKATRFEPELNKSYLRLSEHYGFGILPARPYKPKDKAKVEKAVQVVESRILAAIRDMTFFNIDDLNKEISRRIHELNDEPFQKLSGSRRSWFEAVDAPALSPLPRTDFTFENWELSVRVPKDYHISVERHFYSVPCRLASELVDIRITDNVIEVFHKNARVASHIRSGAEGQKTTLEEHMPAQHAAYQGMSVEKFMNWAEKIGPSTSAVVVAILQSKPHPQLSFDQCWGLLRSLTSKYGKDDVETACHHALLLASPSYLVVKTLLKKGIENLPTQLPLDLPKVSHPNIRGPNQFQ